LEEVEEEEEFRRIPTSAAPLDWGHGGRHQTIRVIEYGGAAGCGALYTILRSSSERLRRLRQVNDYVDYVKWTTTSTTCVFIEYLSTTFIRECNPRFRSSRVS
jgi:hypothetical protein